MAEITTTTTTSAPPSTPKKKAPGLTFKRYFTKAGVSPYDELEWELRLAQITDSQGGIIFEQKDVEVPKDWSMTATNIVASKYLHGPLDTPERETGVRAARDPRRRDHSRLGHQGRLLPQRRRRGHLPRRARPPAVAAEGGIQFAGMVQRRLRSHRAQLRRAELALESRRPSASSTASPAIAIAAVLGLLHQLGARFARLHPHPRQDRRHALQVGIGHGHQPVAAALLHRSRSPAAAPPRGPLSFMKGFDAFAGVIKSGGKTRRAAKMVILNIDHPDIVDFIECKQKEEAKAWALVEAGYDGSGPDSDAYSSIFFQNANNSVRVTDDFMYAVLRDGDFSTRAVKDGRPVQTFKARELLRKISDATWHCGDPGMQYDTTVNRWHTSKNTARINASNPCSEYMFLDDSACNLASLNLMKFAPNGTFDVEAYRHACAVMITAQEILVDNSGYPDRSDRQNSHDYRPLGLGYANLGALLMAAGLPYDSDAGRDYAACVTAIMCGEAYLQSSKIAELCQPLTPATAQTGAKNDLSSRAELDLSERSKPSEDLLLLTTGN